MTSTMTVTSAEHAATKEKVKQPIIWFYVVLMTFFHFMALYGLLTLPYKQIRWQTYLWAYFLYIAGMFGTTAGAHRLWSHRSFKAKWPLRVILLICFSVAGQYSVYDWVRDHRLHHKYSETDADPHNPSRGFFFAHIGWIMMRKHPEVLRRGRQVDMSDILADPLVRFHTKYFSLLKLLFCFVIPMMVPPLCWGESWYVSIFGPGFLRYVAHLNSFWAVNSLAHKWGSRPYDKEIMPTDNLFATWLTLGEGWHNYHHAFPVDYKTAELGPSFINWTTYLIEMFSRWGWAYDLKSPSDDLVRKVVERRGDGSHPKWAGKSGKVEPVGKDESDNLQQWEATGKEPEE